MIPKTEEERRACTYDFVGLAIAADVKARFPRDVWILDVGAGWGKYRFLLPEYPHVHALEAWRPYIQTQRLHEIYEAVHEGEAQRFDELESYDVIILGDMFEHMSRDDALALTPRLTAAADEVYVALPFQMEQNALDGNPYEVHRQADLTPELMGRLYPQLRLLTSDGRKGVYVKA